MSVFKCGIKFKRVLGDSKQSAKNKLVAHGFIDKAYNIPNFYEFQKAHKEMNDFASKLLERRVQLYNLNNKGTIAYPIEDIFREIDAKRREIAASKSLTPTFQDKKDAFRKEKLANEQITSVRDIIATQDSPQERFEDLSEIESTEEVPTEPVSTMDIIDEEIQQKSKEIQELATKQVQAITEQEPKEGLNISDVMNNQSSEEVKFDERTGQISLFPLLSIEEQWQTNQSKLLSKYPDITYEDFVSLTEQERENLLACL